MNKIERMKAALEGEPIDRVPFSLFYHFSKAQFSGESMAKAHIEYYNPPTPTS